MQGCEVAARRRVLGKLRHLRFVKSRQKTDGGFVGVFLGEFIKLDERVEIGGLRPHALAAVSVECTGATKRSVHLSA